MILVQDALGHLMKPPIEREFLLWNILSQLVLLKIGLNYFALCGLEFRSKGFNLSLSNAMLGEQRTVIVERNWFDFYQWFLSILELLRNHYFC